MKTISILLIANLCNLYTLPEDTTVRLDEVAVSSFYQSSENQSKELTAKELNKLNYGQEPSNLFSTMPSIISLNDNGTEYGYGYFRTLGLGLLHWNLHITKGKVQTREISMPAWRFTLLITTICYIAAYFFLTKAGGTHPALDGFTTVFAIAAQLLMIFRYAENWFLWFIVDVACIILFTKVGDWCMVAQYLFWTANCVYGYLKWKLKEQPNATK